MKKNLLFLLLSVPFALFAQVSPVYYMSNYIRVVQPEFDDSSDLASKMPDLVTYHNPKVKYDTLLNPFTGGLNNAMFFNIDFNGDGISDLYVFDRDLAENQFLLFQGITNNSTLYRYAPQYNYAFPHNLSAWVEMVDYNNDGLPDIFTASTYPYSNTGALTYKNISYIDPISKKFVPKFKLRADSLFYYDSLGQRTAINLPSASNPQFLDVDKDGYLDILSFDLNLNAPVFYRNRGKSSDSLSFYFTKSCWGYFEELVQHRYQPWDCEKAWTGTWDPDTSYHNHKVHSSGAHFSNSMCAFDVDEDGDIDLLLGDGLNDSLAFLQNGNIDLAGKSYHRDTMTNLYPKNNNKFPIDYPAIIQNMPTAYNVDVNHDTLNDLIIDAGEPTNLFADTVHFSQRQGDIWYYHNAGSKPKNGLPGSNIFQITTKDFLQNTMVDWGVNSAPCFIDVDKDGRKDLIMAVGDGSKPQGNSHLILYLNKAGKTASSKPYLLYQTDDYMGLAKLKTGILRPVPAAYINTQDSVTDLIMGNDSGQVMYFKDRSAKKSPADFQLVASNLKYLKKGKLVPIAVNANSAPAAADINGDGKTDLLIGSNDATISYYRCQGYGPAPDYVPYFVLVTDTFGSLFTSVGTTQQTAPCVADLDKDGKPDLLVGDVYGRLFYFHDFDTIQKLVPNHLISVHDYGSGKDSTQQFSTYTIPAVADLDQDGLPDIMLGCRRGGLLFLGSANNELETLHTSGIEQVANYRQMDMSLFPNPAKNSVTLEYNNNSIPENSTLIVLDMLGRQVIKRVFELQNGKGDEQFSTSGLSNGIYIVNVETAGQILYSNKLVISK